MAMLKELVEVELQQPPEQVGRALSVIPTYLDSYENLDKVKVFIPVSQIAEIHPTHIRCQYWVAESKGLV